MWGGGCLEPPLGARGGPTRAAGLPDFRGSVLSVPVVGSRVVPVFFRSRPFFFPPPHTCLVSFLAGRPEATPRSICSPLSPGRGGRWSLGDCAVVSTREFAHTRNTDTTLSGGSLGLSERRLTINRVTRCGGCCAAGSLLAGPTPQPGSGPPSPEVQTCGRLSVWRARPASREPGLPRASALAASSRSAVPALARAPRSWPRVGASRTAASPVFLGPVPRGNPPRPRGARGWARPHLLWSRLAVEGVRAPRWWSVPCGRGVVGVAVDEGRSVALRWLSVCVWVLRWGRRGRPLAGLARSPGAAHPPACVEGERGRERREVVSPVALRGRVWRPASVRPSLPRWAPSRRTRPLGAVGARGPRGSSSSPLLLHPGGTRSGAGPRDAAASVRRCESPPGVASSGRERASLTRCVPASLGGTRRLWAVRPGGCV